MNELKIVFAGTPAFGLPCLDALIEASYSLQAIYTQPDRPAGRGRKLQASAVKDWAIQQHIPVYQPLNFKTQEALDELAALTPDVLIVIAYGLILPKAVLEIPKFGCINAHASLLPRWRGASPIQQAILHGDAETGVTIMQMDVGLDTGAMLCKATCPITSTDTASSLHDKLAQLAAKPLLNTLDALSNNTSEPQIQNNELATYAAKINKEDAHIDWQQSAIDIDRKIRGLNPWPIAYTHIGTEVLRIHQAQVVPVPSSPKPGAVISIDKKGLLVATGAQGLLLEKIQLPGAKIITIADWLNSRKVSVQPGFVFE